MINLFPSFTRASAFFRKEIVEMLRQPRLIATLVLGPFVILLLFGVGYRTDPRGFRTLFVVQPNSDITEEGVQYYGKSMDSILIFSGTSGDLNQALDQLNKGQVDLVVEEPRDAMQQVKENHQAVFTIYHREIDPTEISYINYLGWLYVNTLNQQVLRSFATSGQQDAASLHNSLQEAHQNVADVKQALGRGDEATAQQKQDGLARNVAAVSAATAGAALMEGASGGQTDSMHSTLADLQLNVGQLSTPRASTNDRMGRLDKIDRDLTTLDGMLGEFQGVDPGVLVSPFRSEVKNVAGQQPSMSVFFAPAVLALLLQHLALTFGALSVIHERNLGTIQLLHVSPLSAGEALFGKYISYMVFGSVVAVALTALLVFGLHVPMNGSWLYFSLVLLAVLFTSLGVGFVISLTSQTDSQAVQASMIVLLASVFFSGFIMNLDMLLQPVQSIAWLIPTTYGTLLLRDIALRGLTPNWMLLGILAGAGLVLMLIAWRLMHRLISAPQ